MRTIFIDSDFKCHCEDNGAMSPITTDFFDGKCDAFVEGYRLVPNGETWVREDGMAFHGELIFPWKDYSVLSKAQRDYERQMLAEYSEALKTMGVSV